MRNGFFKQAGLILTLVLFAIISGRALAEQADLPVISIIIDDIGYRHIDDTNALNLPGPITYAILPHSPYAEKMSRLAHATGKDIILHLPMEAVEHEKNRLMGPGGLKLEMDRIQFIQVLGKNFRSLPNIIGVNNHMGSLLTMDRERMEWLMDFINTRNIFYLDSLTNHNSVASVVAERKNVPYLKRDVFLDNEKDMAYIQSQFNELIQIAKRKGSAIAIGHPHPETVAVLQDQLDKLDKHGVRLVSLKEMLDQQQGDDNKPGRLSQK
jgi:polysaccharide deacetylase 2 family uncharacterized protein YibQ